MSDRVFSDGFTGAFEPGRTGPAPRPRKLGASLTRSGNYADAEGVLREALDIAGPSGPDRARVLSALAHVAHGRRRTPEAMNYIDQAIEVARQSGAQDLVTAFTDTRRAWA